MIQRILAVEAEEELAQLAETVITQLPEPVELEFLAISQEQQLFERVVAVERAVTRVWLHPRLYGEPQAAQAAAVQAESQIRSLHLAPMF
jgi:hypothetical protein